MRHLHCQQDGGLFARLEGINLSSAVVVARYWLDPNLEGDIVYGVCHQPPIRVYEDLDTCPLRNDLGIVKFN